MSQFRTPPKFLIAAGFVAGICFLIGLLASSQLPKMRSWVLVQIEAETREHLPIRVLPASVDIDFLPLGTTLRGVKIFPKDEIKDFLNPLEIKRVSATISLWQLLQGKLRLSSVEVEGTHIVVRIPKAEKKKDEKPLAGLFKMLEKIPVSHLRLSDVSIDAALTDPKMNAAVDALELEASKVRGGFSIQLAHATARILDPESNARILIDVEADMMANPQNLIVEGLKIRRGDSFFVASGKGVGDVEALDLKDFDLQLRSEVFLDSMRSWVVKTFAKEKWAKSLPKLKGRLFVDGRIKKPHGKAPSGDFNAHAEGFSVDKIGLGHLETEGTYKNDLIRIPKLIIKNASTTSTIETIQIDLKKDPATNTPRIALEGTLKVPSLNINELLFQFGVGRLPVFLNVKGEAPCKGTLRPAFALECKANLNAKDILIEDGTDKKKATIVKINQATAVGDFHVDENLVSYHADLTMPDSKGRSSGAISYETGFKISYEGDRVSFKDVANLANLKLEGVARIKGTTEGNSDFGKLQMSIDGSDVWFEDFWLGNVKGAASYAAGELTFQDLTGSAGVSRYSGEVGLDLKAKKISVTGRVPFFDARDLLKIFSRRVQLPFSALGTGQASIRASGPLDLGHLSYDLRSSVFRGSVAGESFDQAHFDVKSVGGEVRAERVQVSKGQALLTLTGVAHPSGAIETTVHGRGIRLEDTNTIARSGVAISGAIDFEMSMNGPVLAPETDMKGTLTKTAIGEQPMPDSNFRLKFLKNSIEGGGQFLGDVVEGQFVLPLSSDAPFKLKASSKDWNYAPVFAAIAGPASRKDYDGHLTTSIDLASPNGGFWNADGAIEISKLSLSRGALKLQNPKPMVLSMKKGQLETKDVSMIGDSIFLNAQSTPNAASKLDLNVSGKLDLGLLALVTPFFEDLRGLLSFKLQIKGGNVPSNVIGSAYIERGYLKFFDFPHAFEDIRADLLFNQQKILFNSLRAEFGGGRITASGGMELKGLKNTPVNVAGSFEKITLNVPEKMQTSGSGDFTFTGNTFPFLLKGNYAISDGLVTKQFGGESGDTYSISRRDAYLPDFLVQENFVPLLVDMNIDISKNVAILNDLVDGHVSGALTVKGNPTKPAIGGSIALEKESKVFFRSTTFEIVSANVLFGGTTDIDPKLYVSARTRIDPYDVNLLVQGSGSKPELVLSSAPQLAEKDIVSLLAFGATDTNLDKTVKSNQQSTNIGQIGASGIASQLPLSKVFKERTGFDVQFTTGFDDTNTSVQKIVATRQLGKQLTVSGGYSYGNSQSAEAHIRYRLNDHLSLIGAYEENNYTEVNVQQAQIESQPNVFGLDMEYKLEFK